MLTSYRKARHAAPPDGMSRIKKITAVLVIGLAAAISVMTAASAGKTAYIIDGDKSYTVAADSTDLDTVLAQAGVTLGEGDKTIVTEQSGDSININVKRAFTVSVTADGKTTDVRLTSGTAAQAIEAACVKTSPNDFITPAPETELNCDSEVTVVRGIKVYLEKNGGRKLVYVPEGTVDDALETVNCKLADENGAVKGSDPVKNGMVLCVDSFLSRKTLVIDKIEPTVIEEACSTLPAGEKSVKQEGKPGRLETTYSEKYVNGELVEKKEIGKEVTIKPENRIVLVGTKTSQPAAETVKDSDSDTCSDILTEENEQEVIKTIIEASGSADEEEIADSEFGKASDDHGAGFSYNTLITGVCTAYNEINGITATGTAPKVGTVAVNPDVIPYGTRLYICSSDGSYVYGYAVAEDTGTACMAGDIVVDLYMNSENECDDFGRRELNIYILD